MDPAAFQVAGVILAAVAAVIILYLWTVVVVDVARTAFAHDPWTDRDDPRPAHLPARHTRRAPWTL